MNILNPETGMQRAIEVGRENAKHPFGAILVHRESGRIVAEGCNRSHESPIWHGEMQAIQNFAESSSSESWQDLDLYSTAEPCPMCQSAILWAGISRVFFGISIPRLVEFGWKQIRLSARDVANLAPFTGCEIVGGILEAECDQLFQSAQKLREG